MCITMSLPDNPGITGSKSRSQDGQRRDSLNVMCIAHIKDCANQVPMNMHTKYQELCKPSTKDYAYQTSRTVHTKYQGICIPNIKDYAYQIPRTMHTIYPGLCVLNIFLSLCRSKVNGNVKCHSV